MDQRASSVFRLVLLLAIGVLLCAGAGCQDEAPISEEPAAPTEIETEEPPRTEG